MSSTEERFSLALHNTARAWRQALDRRLRHLGVGQAAWLAIAAIARARKPLSQADLAASLGVEAPTVVAMVDRLVKGGYVRREPSEADRRIKRVLLTQAGHDLYAQVRAQADIFRHELLGSLDKQQLQAMTLLLEHLQAQAEADRRPDTATDGLAVRSTAPGEAAHG
jgi:MarR family transcriptional regulator for hemolysin